VRARRETPRIDRDCLRGIVGKDVRTGVFFNERGIPGHPGYRFVIPSPGILAWLQAVNLRCFECLYELLLLPWAPLKAKIEPLSCTYHKSRHPHLTAGLRATCPEEVPGHSRRG